MTLKIVLLNPQTQLDEEQRADIDVRTKAGELIGCLSAVLWIYNNGNSVHIIFMIWKLMGNKINYFIMVL